MSFFKTLQAWFGPAQPQPTRSEVRAVSSSPLRPDVYFHEDDYCQCELLPSQLENYCIAENRRIQEFAAAHSDGGIGYTGIYLRPAPPGTYQDLLIPLPEFASAVSSHLRPNGRVFTGYSSYREVAANTHAWGMDTFHIFAESNADGVVAAAWLTFGGLLSVEVLAVHEALLALPHHENTILVDWSWHQVVPLKDATALLKYLRQGTDEGSHGGA